MAIRKKTFGIIFPFDDSSKGDYIKLSEDKDSEVQASILHVLLTQRGERYYLPDFGTNLRQHLFSPLDDKTLVIIEDEIRESLKKWIPNLEIESVNIKRYDITDEAINENQRHQISISLDYQIRRGTFNASGVRNLTFTL